MTSDLSQLDDIIESDILEALGQEIPEELKNIEEVDLIQNIPEEYLTEDEIIPTTRMETDNKEVDELLEDDLPELDELEENIEEEISKDDMLDELLEDDLPELDEPEENVEEEISEPDIAEEFLEQKAPVIDSTQEKQEFTTNNCTDLVSMLSQLLNNKTIEITIKIRD